MRSRAILVFWRHFMWFQVAMLVSLFVFHEVLWFVILIAVLDIVLTAMYYFWVEDRLVVWIPPELEGKFKDTPHVVYRV